MDEEEREILEARAARFLQSEEIDLEVETYVLVDLLVRFYQENSS